ncbi:MAG: flagellar biosynthetic protein FliR [Candidatus Goldiibacteriota bacterium]
MEQFNIFDIALEQFQVYVLITIRISAIFFSAPVISSRNVPPLIKIALAFLIAIIVFPVVEKDFVIPGDIGTYGVIVFKQVLLGVAIGFAANLIFTAIQLAGQIIDLQMGFGIVNVIDPVSNTQVSIIGQFKFVMGILLFMAINGHHMLFKAIVDSFAMVPLGNVGITEPTVTKLNAMFSEMFLLAFKIAGPATIALFLSNVTLGLIARTIPQMNVFIVGLPMNIMIGIAAVLVSMPILVNLFNTLLTAMWDDIYFIIRTMRV